MKQQRKRITRLRTARAIEQIVGIIECQDFEELAREARIPEALHQLDRAADILRDLGRVAKR